MEKQFANLKTWFASQSKKEATLFKNTKYPITFKPFHLYQGLAVMLLLFVVASFFIPKTKINTAALIKSAEVKHLTAVVAGGQPVQWTVLVKKSDITKKNYLTALPTNAQNIKISSITATQAKAIFNSQPKQPSLQQKTQIAKASEPKNYFAADLLGSISNFFAADLTDAAQTIADDTNSQI